MSKNIIIALSLSLSMLLTACMTTPALPDEQRPSTWGTLVQEEHNFYQVNSKLFRSEQPNILFIPQLKKYNITTIINLRNSNNDAKILNMQPFNLVHIPINTWAINRNDILKIMQHIQQAHQRGEKVLIHCYHGSDRTGASIAMYRILFENWSVEQATKEMKHGGYGFHVVWKNIENLFSEENITWLRQQLANTHR